MLSIRPETADDIQAIRAVHDAAFGRPQEGRLVDALRRGKGFDARLSLVAEDVDAEGAVARGRHEGRGASKRRGIIAHVLFSPVRIERAGRGGHDALALAPMGVVPARQRQGVGTELLRVGLDQCRAMGHGIVIVLGHGGYYPRFGFEPARPRGIEPPFDVSDDVWMVLELVGDALHGVRGTVRYPRAFDKV